MTLSDLIHALEDTAPDLPLIFEAPSGRAAPGYHVTELKHATVAAIDCGGQRNAWQEVTLQILDGQGDHYMSVGKFCSIATRSVAEIEGLGRHTLRVEFGAGNDRLELLSPQLPVFEDGAVVVPLGAERALCKPAQQWQGSATTASCCGAGRVVSCCG